MKKLFHNYQRLSICKRKLDAMNLVHALCTYTVFGLAMRETKGLKDHKNVIFL